MSKQRNRGWSRREFLDAAAVAGTGALLGLRPEAVAEGAARQTKKEFTNYLHIAQGSLSELNTQIELARRLGFLDDESWRIHDKRMERIDKTISGLIHHLTKK